MRVNGSGCYRIPVDDENLSDAFFAVSRRLRARTKAVLGLSPSLARAVSVLAGHGESRLSVLADHLRIAPRSATEVADDLERHGLAARRPDPADRRAVLIGLTPEGERTADRIRAARQAEGERFFAALSADDRADLLRLLRLLRDDPAAG
jgi:DNA-binding MarR family transcriptional regulator